MTKSEITLSLNGITATIDKGSNRKKHVSMKSLTRAFKKNYNQILVDMLQKLRPSMMHSHTRTREDKELLASVDLTGDVLTRILKGHSHIHLDQVVMIAEKLGYDIPSITPSLVPLHNQEEE